MLNVYLRTSCTATIHSKLGFQIFVASSPEVPGKYSNTLVKRPPLGYYDIFLVSGMSILLYLINSF